VRACLVSATRVHLWCFRVRIGALESDFFEALSSIDVVPMVTWHVPGRSLASPPPHPANGYQSDDVLDLAAADKGTFDGHRACAGV
jgi:hypothetical protein